MDNLAAGPRTIRRWRGLLLREIRENRSLLLYAPCLLVLVAILLGMRLFTLLTLERQKAGLELLFNRFEGLNASDVAPLLTSAGALNLLFIIGIATSYLASSLYADRKEQSYFFWQSMPISDRSTILSKVVTAVVMIPGIYMGVLTAGSLMLIIDEVIRHGLAVDGDRSISGADAYACYATFSSASAECISGNLVLFDGDHRFKCCLGVCCWECV